MSNRLSWRTPVRDWQPNVTLRPTTAHLKQLRILADTGGLCDQRMELTRRAHKPVAALEHEEAMKHRSQRVAQWLHFQKTVWTSLTVVTVRVSSAAVRATSLWDVEQFEPCRALNRYGEHSGAMGRLAQR